MSLKLNYIDLETGSIIKEAYFKIMSFKGSCKQNDTYNIIISVCIYASQEAKENNLRPIIENKEFDLFIESSKIENKPLFKVCYKELKKQFPEAIDC